MSKPIQTVEELGAVLHWRGKHAQAIRERHALQLDLNQRDEQIATLDLQREAHLRNSQVAERRVDELQQRLTAADERADAGIAFVIRLIQCSEGQTSIATGYLRDILDVLKQTEGVLTPATCTWKFGAFSWHTACGQEWMLNDGTPEQNGMRFCHSCGNALVAEEPEDA